MKLTITKSEFEKIELEALIIDVRDNWEQQELKKISNSLHIPFLELVNNLENYIKDKNKIVITYCNYGNRSGQAARMSGERGYLKVFVLEGRVLNICLFFLSTSIFLKRVIFTQKIIFQKRN